MVRNTLLSASFICVLLSGCDNEIAQPAVADNSYVGAETCAGCHSAETELWTNSHHDLAMQVATAATVLGDFADSVFKHNAETSRFYVQGDQHWVETSGPNGDTGAYPVRYTFGVYPLQQYLLELPDGKIQAFGAAWDTRPAEEGGQRWFHVYGDDPIDYTDVLHWTQPSQNWETMCADCHSTNLISTYLLEEDRFETTWDELNVACEACHGPGGAHVAWAENPDDRVTNKGLDLLLDENRTVNWVPDPDSGNSVRSIARTSNKELNTCAGCHSRRARIAEGNHPATPFLDNYSPALVEPPLYHADGQILDEVYVYGSFLQSKMHAAGVTCSDCHDPHSLQLRADGAQVCLQCHASDSFATVEHTLHQDPAIDCIDCHMPERNYMQIDARNDHSFRIPRPELTQSHGMPNACNDCHRDKDAEWAMTALNADQATDRHWTELAVLSHAPDLRANAARSQLFESVAAPAIVRSSLMARGGFDNTAENRALLERYAASDNPQERVAAARALENSHPQLAVDVGLSLLDDELLAVRLAATAALGSTDPMLVPGSQQARLQQAFDEYRAAQLVSAERPESYINIANLERRQGRRDTAEANYQTALRLNDRFVPAYINLADLYREWQRERDAERILMTGLQRLPDQPDLLHSLGLSLVRQDRLPEAMPLFEAAAAAPEAPPRYTLVYAIGLETTENREAAIAVLEQGLERYGENAELRNAYLQFTQAP